jgi:hypothetical protein
MRIIGIYLTRFVHDARILPEMKPGGDASTQSGIFIKP